MKCITVLPHIPSKEDGRLAARQISGGRKDHSLTTLPDGYNLDHV